MPRTDPTPETREALQRALEVTEKVIVKTGRARNGELSGIISKVNSRRRSSRTSKVGKPNG